MNVLERGYSIISDSEGHIVTSADEVEAGDVLTVTLNKGRLVTEVKDKVVTDE